MVNGFDRRTKYVTDVDFLPPNGFLYVDKCGLKWVANQEGNFECWNAQKERIASFYEAFKDKDDVITVESVLVEILDDVNFLKNKMREKSRGNYRSRNKDLGREIKCASESVKVCGAIYALLRDNMKTCIPREYAVHPEDARDFVERFIPSHGTLETPDKDLVTAALSAGPPIGLLTADKPMMEAYKSGVKKFQLWDHSLCNAIESELTYPCRG